jgi:hypothetical protein
MARIHDNAENQRQTAEHREAAEQIIAGSPVASQPVRVDRGHDGAAPNAAAAPSAATAGLTFIELSSQAYSFLIDAIGAVSRRRVAYAKSLYEIASRPYASSAVEQTIRENFERANEVISLSIAELQTSGEKAAEFNEAWVKHAVKLQGSAVDASRSLVNAGIANLEVARDSGSAQLATLAKQVEAAQSRIAASVGS